MVEVKIVVDKVNYDDVFRKYKDTHFFKGTVGYFMSREKQERELLTALNTTGCRMVERMAHGYLVHIRAEDVSAQRTGTSALEIICKLRSVDYKSLFYALAENASPALRWLIFGATFLTWERMREFLTLTYINISGKRVVSKIAKKNNIHMDVKNVRAHRT